MNQARGFNFTALEWMVSVLDHQILAIQAERDLRYQIPG